MVEFALVAPMFLALFVGLADMGRGLLAYNELAIGSRTGAREAVLQYNVGSNTAAPSCYPSTCTVPGVLPDIRKVAGFGFPISYSDASSSGTAPAYCGASVNGSYTANGTQLPLTLTLPSSDAVNTIYVCIYEYDPSLSSGAAFWATSGGVARQSGHQVAVVDLKMKWTSVTLSLLGVAPTINLDSQTVQRIEY